MRVRVVFEKKIYKNKNINWTIPIVESAGRYYTGQNLEYKKMVGEIPLTAEEAELYPFIINPNNIYKLPHGRIIDTDNPADKALYDLVLISGRFAKSKAEYKKAEHIGYFEDKEKESVSLISEVRAEANALSKVLSLNNLEIESVSLMLAYSTKKEQFDISLNSSSPNQKQAAMVKLAKKDPKIILNCFEEYNPNVKDDMFIYKLIHHKLIIRSMTDFYEGTSSGRGRYLGKSINDVKDFLSNKSNFSMRDKFINLLKQYETGMVITIPLSQVSENVDASAKIGMLKSQIKAALFDKELSEAEEKLTKLRGLVDIKDEDYQSLVGAYNIAKQAEEEQLKTQKLENLKVVYNGKEIPELLSLFKVKGSKFKLEDIKEFEDDKERIITYMLEQLNK